MQDYRIRVLYHHIIGVGSWYKLQDKLAPNYELQSDPNFQGCSADGGMCKAFPFIAAMVILIVTTGTFNAFTIRWLLEDTSFNFIPIVVISEIIFLFTLLNFLQTAFTDPGILQKENEEESDNDFHTPLFKNVIINNTTVRLKYCDTCQFYRPPRTSHCSMCNRCIENFDHHCPWVNNCVGRRNYRFFFCFLMWLSLHILLTLSLCIYRCASVRPLWSDIPSLVVAIICFLTVFPIIGLLSFHIALIKMGLTTNEQVTHKFSGSDNPYSHGCAKNFINLFCKAKPLRYLGYKEMCNAKPRLTFLRREKGYKLQASEDNVSEYSLQVENTNVW